ncbi:MAG: sodium-dependent transporter [Bacteroidales bacterium]|nr:sodium-dependent transporter [Bacteroidales bacterium]
MAGAAIGLGKIWRFPFMVGEHGGAAFIIVYVVATLLLSLPVFLAEVIIGRRSRTSAYGSWAKLRPTKFWKIAGFLPVLIPIIITSYYSVVGGWALEYLIKSCQMTFIHTAPDQTSAIFGTFISQTWTPLIMAAIFLIATGVVIAGGVKGGIEKFSKITMPVLFVLILVIMVYSISLPGAKAGLLYLIKPDFSQMNAQTFAYAMGQSFYSLSLGMGAIITYGSYVSKDENLFVSGLGTAASDLMFAILAGFAIMPAVFAAGIEPNAGPGLIFQTIPFVFSKMGVTLPIVSAIVSIIFFLTILVAALTSNMCMYEVVVAYLVEKFGIKRGKASVIVFAVIGSLGIFSSLSFGPLEDVHILGKGLFDFFDWLSSNILLTIAGFLSVVFAGWIMKEEDLKDEFTNGGTKQKNIRWFNFVRFLMRWVAPTAVVLIFITNFIL